METKIIEIVKIVLEDSMQDSVEISLESNLKDDVGLDSFGLALLTVKIEDEFGVDVFEDAFPETVQDVVDILKG
ncbi:acyl carrier protein [bacterium]|nr:acyl carrier protein [bacterium]